MVASVSFLTVVRERLRSSSGDGRGEPLPVKAGEQVGDRFTP
ncbi:hypothetical protein STSP_02810 [Streptomyces jeddahensis]|uniref:Uncharacterized protein n=1 Tax=Streptomyces jeddahensis TaxID=1716141 RepID=A0A177I1R0_9ACTN|nr:hypothetical protein STSP_02810 [Streptomyces jeddahensis]